MPAFHSAHKRRHKLCRSNPRFQGPRQHVRPRPPPPPPQGFMAITSLWGLSFFMAISAIARSQSVAVAVQAFSMLIFLITSGERAPHASPQLSPARAGRPGAGVSARAPAVLCFLAAWHAARRTAGLCQCSIGQRSLACHATVCGVSYQRCLPWSRLILHCDVAMCRLGCLKVRASFAALLGPAELSARGRACSPPCSPLAGFIANVKHMPAAWLGACERAAGGRVSPCPTVGTFPRNLTQLPSYGTGPAARPVRRTASSPARGGARPRS